MDEHARGRAAIGIGTTELVQPTPAGIPLPQCRCSHEAVGPDLPVLLRQVGADQHDFAAKDPAHSGGIAVKAAQHVRQPISRNGFQRRSRREQQARRHLRAFGAAEQSGRERGQILPVSRLDLRGQPAQHAVGIGGQLGIGDRAGFVLAGVRGGVEHRPDKGRRRVGPGRARQHDPVARVRERREKVAVVLLPLEPREAIGRVAEDDVKPDRAGLGLAQPINDLGPDGAQKYPRHRRELRRVEAVAIEGDHRDGLIRGAGSGLIGHQGEVVQHTVEQAHLATTRRARQRP